MGKHHLKGFSNHTRAYIRDRDNYKCQFSNCNADGTQVHHIYPKRIAFNRGMKLYEINSPDNGILLCEKHHEFMHKNGNWNFYLKDFRDLIANASYNN